MSTHRQQHVTRARRIHRALTLAGTLSVACGAIAWSAPVAAASDACVGAGQGCAASVQQALDAARDGDVIRLGRGTFPGGVIITKSVTLVGAGSSSTVLSGGGPVVTIGSYLAGGAPLRVAIVGITIRNGTTTSSPFSTDWVGSANVIAAGGGIAVNPTAGFGPGADLTLRDTVVTGNAAAPSATAPGGPVCPGGNKCPFARASGGGIDTWGDLTLINSVVSRNVAGGPASDATGGGIHSWSGDITLRDSSVVDNQALVIAPNGRFAEGGGIFSEGAASITVKGSSVSGNRASLTSDLPYFVGDADGPTMDMNANGGGIHTGNGSTVVIANSKLNRNEVAVDDVNGEPYALDSAILPSDSSLVLPRQRGGRQPPDCQGAHE